VRILIAIGVRRQKEAGAAGVALNHAAELEKLGHSVQCWFLDDVLDGSALSNRFESLLFALAIAKQILKRRTEFDVVNLHAPWGGAYGVWRKLFHPRGSPPYVMTMQGSEERYVNAMRIEHRKGRAWHFSWKNRLWHRAYHQTLYDCSIRSADYGAVANREAWIMAELNYGREPGRIWFVPNGVEHRFFVTREYRDRGPLRLLYVGTWLDRKGVYYLADAFKCLADKFPEVTLTVAGCIAPEQEVRIYFGSGLDDKIRVIPFVKRDEMPSIYMEHDIFVFPSLVEGMPLTLLEAMATGMPVVTTNTCGMADVIESGANGLLVSTSNASDLAGAVQQLITSSDLRRQLGLAGQRSARSYTWDRITRKLENVFELAVGSGKHGCGSAAIGGNENL
jgi:glycosyltransferase involved in cell wall biosynthesis